MDTQNTYTQLNNTRLHPKNKFRRHGTVDLHQFGSFIDLTSYYYRFVEGYADFAWLLLYCP